MSGVATIAAAVEPKEGRGLVRELKDRLVRINDRRSLFGEPMLYRVGPDDRLTPAPELFDASSPVEWRFETPPAGGATGYVLLLPTPAEEMLRYRKLGVSLVASVSPLGDDQPPADETTVTWLTLSSLFDDGWLRHGGRNPIREKIGSEPAAIRTHIRLGRPDYLVGSRTGLTVHLNPAGSQVRISELELWGFKDDFCTDRLAVQALEACEPEESAFFVVEPNVRLGLGEGNPSRRPVQDARNLLGAREDSVLIESRWPGRTGPRPPVEVRLLGDIGKLHPDIAFSKVTPRILEGDARYLASVHQALVAPTGLLCNTQREVLRESFRRYPVPHPHRMLQSRDDGGFELLRPLTRFKRLSGPAIYLATEHDGHFGHLLLETLSKCWYVEHEALKSLPVLVNEFMDEMHIRLLELAGVPRDRMVFLTDPLIVDELIIPSQLFVLDFDADPSIVRTWDRVRAGCQGKGGRGRRVYLSRRRWTIKRRMLNEAEVEAMMREHGFEIVYLEELSIDDKVALAADAEVICGALGSGLHVSMFSKAASRVIALAPNQLLQNNLSVIGALRQQRIDYLLGHFRVPEGEKVNNYFNDWDMDLELLQGFLAAGLEAPAGAPDAAAGGA
jgi:capsular polysaccharide biosynthesis protein